MIIKQRIRQDVVSKSKNGKNYLGQIEICIYMDLFNQLYRIKRELLLLQYSF